MDPRDEVEPRRFFPKMGNPRICVLRRFKPIGMTHTPLGHREFLSRPEAFLGHLPGYRRCHPTGRLAALSLAASLAAELS